MSIKRTGWASTDELERAIREERGREEAMRVRRVWNKDGVFGDCEVVTGEGADRNVYRVELRTLEGNGNWCSCPDFAKSGLGMCKHIACVAGRARRRAGKKGAVSPFTEVWVEAESGRVRVAFAKDAPLWERTRLGKLLDGEGRLEDGSAEGLAKLLAVCERLEHEPESRVRVSEGVRMLAARLAGKARLEGDVARFARAYADAGGKWPFLRLPLYPYQIGGALHLASKGRAILADEMGLGKTVQAIAAALLLRELEGAKKALVIVPASLKAEWEDELARFAGMRAAILRGGRKERLAAYEEFEEGFLVANYEQILRDWREVNGILKPDLVILDEAQRIKNWQSKTARNLKRLESRFAFVLTGTPLENRIDELYSIAEFVEPELFGSLFRFNREYYRTDAEGRVTGMKNLAGLHEKAGQVLLRRRKAGIEEGLPERSDRNYFVGMTEEQTARYAEQEDGVARLCAMAKRRPLSPKEMERLQRMLAMMRMLCDTCYILDPKVKDSPKADEAMRVLGDVFAEDPSRKVLVFSEWTRMLELMQERLDAAGWGWALHTGAVPQDKRRLELRRFKSDPECRVLLTSEAGGVGLNLQAASVVMNLDLPWNPAKLEQRIARAWRKHQTRDVQVLNLVAENTIEHRMIGKLKFKQGLADAVLDATGDAADFEQENAGKAFMARVLELMDGTPSGAAKKRPAGETGGERSSSGVPEKSAPPPKPEPTDGERLHAWLAEGHPELGLTEETAYLLARLKKLGIIQFTDGVAESIFGGAAVSTEADLARQRRLKAARSAFEVAERKARMGQMLAEGGFLPEGSAALSEAVRLAAGAAFFALSGTAADTPVPAESDNFIAIRNALALADADALTLQCAIQGQDPGDAPTRTTAFLSLCREKLENP
ncbi:MAG: DEAD/DEAH box helicase [Kiritimatiellae bacterium]|nr:DEAD/DEAH box helicase [Kiritimatiellia bacterium]